MSNPAVYPRPEYPRPDRQRGTLEGTDWLNLNGPWQFRFDGHRRGMVERWYEPDDQEWREQIIVPFCWESLAAWGEGDAAGNDNYYSTRVFLNPLEVTRANHRSSPRYEVGWYRRRVTIPETAIWQDKRVIITVGAADFFSDCWCNGVHLGHHEGGYTPFEFDLTEALQSGPDGCREALIVLRVEDPMDNHEQPVGKQWRWYTTTSGIWQTVFVEPRSATHIGEFRFETDIDRQTVQLTCECVEPTDHCSVRAQIEPPGGARCIEAVIPVFEGCARETIAIAPLFLWNPNEPNLYKVKLELVRSEETLDRVRTYFGMRKIDTAPTEDPDAPAALRLNGVVRYLRGALYQSYFPEGVYTAGDIETLKNDIIYAKKVGFNFLRIHIKIDDPMLLYFADTLGIMLMADFPNFGEGGDTPLGRRRFEEMMRKAIQRDYNHPSIVAWCLFNETWGFGGQTELVQLFAHVTRRGLDPRIEQMPPTAVSASDPVTLGAVSAEGAAPAVDPAFAAAVRKARMPNQAAHAWVQSMWELAKKLDATRLVEDMSVVHWEHLDYFAHGDTDINSWHFYISDYARAKEHIEKVVKATYAGSPFNYVEGFLQKGQPLINSEYGGVGALDGDRDTSWSFKFLTNELRRHGAISAYIYTELTDVEWEYNGFLNYDRTPKEFGYDPSIINESDVLPVDSPPVARCRHGEQVVLPVSSSHYSSKIHENVTLRWRLAGMDTRGHIVHDMVRGSSLISFPHRRVAPAHTIEMTMPNATMLCTLSLEAHTPDGTRIARNFVHYHVTDGYPAPREELPRITLLRARPDGWERSEWTGVTADREEFARLDCCYGGGAGFFEWLLPLDEIDLARVFRLRVLCEASSHRLDTPQTDGDHYASTLQILLNGIPVYRAILPNHPHDSRGVLSYLRGGRGAYGYLAHVTAEGDELRQIAARVEHGHLRLRCEVPLDASPQGGLTVYGAENGRYPVPPTIVLEW